MRGRTRWLARTLGVAAIGALFVPITPAAAQTQSAKVTLNCDGITGDNASSLGDSKSTLGMLPGGGSGLSLDVNVTTTVPAVVKQGSGPFDARFDLTVTLPASVVSSAKLLGLSTVPVNNATFGVQFTGAATGKLSTTVPTQTVNLEAPVVSVNQTITGTVTPDGSGLIIYRPDAARLSIVINRTIGSLEVRTLTVQCAASGLLGTTLVQVPGAPVVDPPIITATGEVGANTLDLLGGGYIRPDEGNPVLPETLATTGSPTPGGTATVEGGVLTFNAPAGGDYEIPLQVCAAPKETEAKPGISEVQQMVLGDYNVYDNTFKTFIGDVARALNPHPLGFTLEFEGQKTRVIGTSFGNQWWNQNVPTPLTTDWVQWINSSFRAPSAATIQAELERLPNIGAGNVTVTGGGTEPYVISFVGALADKDVGQVTISDWWSHLPSEGLDALLAAAGGLGGGDDDGPALPTWEQLNNQLLTGAITFDQWTVTAGDLIRKQLMDSLPPIPDLVADVTSLFPSKPLLNTVTQGEDAIPAGDTGELCTPFVVRYSIGGSGVAGAGEGRTPTGQGPRVAGRDLAFTGSPSTGLTLLGLGLVAVGGGLVLIRRRETMA